MEYPIKVLLDEHRVPFIPFITSNAIVINDSDETIQDVFDDTYRKEEVDQIIHDLGTIQRLCGRVDTYQDLPANPQPGDTWIVGRVSDTNKTEYVWTGTNWEELGPMVDLSGYYTKQEVDALDATLNTNIRADMATAISNGDATTLASAKSYTDQQISGLYIGARIWTGSYTDYLANKQSIDHDYDIILATEVTS